MFDFTKVQIKYPEDIKYSFTGIQKSNNDFLFYIPKGLKDYFSNSNQYQAIKSLFFLLYKSLKTFTDICEEKGYIDRNKIDNRDGVIELDNGSGENTNSNEPTTLYNKLGFLDNILELYDELKILALVSRLGSTENIQHDRIYQNLHRANFLYNGAIYLDTMNLPRSQVHFEQTDLVCLYCYLLTELKQELEEEVSEEIKSLAEKYQEKYLHGNSSLFGEDTYQITLELIIDSLVEIDRRTVYKDSDYWDFYEAIEKFLYSDFNHQENGIIWGINNFYNIWESACLSYLCKINFLENILLLDDFYLDSNIKKEYESTAKTIILDKDLFLVKRKTKPLRPDAVIIRQPKETENQPLGYLLYRDKWNNYSWYTKFEYITQNITRTIQIAFKGQQRNQDTVNELEKFFGVYTTIPSEIKNINHHISKSVFINTSLPKIFFSYWELPTKITSSELNMMKRLNHVFYHAFFHQSIKKSHDFFSKFFLKEETVLQDIGNYFGYFESNDVYLYENQYHPYDSFVRNFIDTKIIDFKYLSEEEIRNKDNKEEIKDKSIRKQFVYEYLLKDYLETQKQIKDPKVSSCFFIPKYHSSKEVIIYGNEYLDGYIDLALVDPIRLLRYYVR